MQQIIKYLQIIVLSAVLLFWGRNLFIPLSVALLISCLLYPVCKWLESRGLGRNLSITLSLLALFVPLTGLILLLVNQLQGFTSQWPDIKIRLLGLYSDVSQFVNVRFNISFESQENWLLDLLGNSGSKIIPFLGSTTYGLSIALVLVLLIPLLAALMLYYRNMLVEVLFRLLPEVSKANVRQLLQDSITSYYSFVKGMLMVYLIVAVLNSIGLAVLGIPQPILFGTIASLLTFVPYVGIVVASLLPVSVAWISYNSVWYPVGVVIVFTAVQVLEANVIFPMAVSNRLKINTLVTLVAILAGGILWGAAGMILFIPFLGILKLVADRSPGLKTLSMLLGNGDKADDPPKS